MVMRWRLCAVATFGMLWGCSTSTVRSTGGGRGVEDGGAGGEPAPSDVSEATRDTSEATSAPVQETDLTAVAPRSTDGDLWVPSAGDFALRDRETGTYWNLRGQAFEGSLKESQLGQVAAFNVFWFSWSTANDGGEVWGRDALNKPGPIEPEPDGRCNVPCDEIRSGGPPPDGIPALDHAGRWNRPKAAQMIAADAATYLRDTDPVLGVFLGGQARAYPYALLNWHENFVDELDGVEFNVTYCPLTGSGILLPADQGWSEPAYFYVSGRLFNDNLTMFERGPSQDEATFWNQVLLRGIAGPRVGEKLVHHPATETTWGRWREMHPGTQVASDDTGYPREYDHNPYSELQHSLASTLFPVSPPWEEVYANKSKVLAVSGPKTERAYPFESMRAEATRLVINDDLDGAPIVVVYDAQHGMAVPFLRVVDGRVLSFDAVKAP